MSPDTKYSLEATGHHLEAIDNMGVLMGITYDPKFKVYIGYSDSSSPDGGAVVY
jgi:gamma-glutamyltranspeptidase/glutathione hydrolase